MVDISQVIAIVGAVGTIASLILTLFVTFWKPDDPSDERQWKEKWRKIIIVSGIILTIVSACLAISLFLNDALIPPKIQVQYISGDSVAVVTLVDGPKWAAKVYYAVGEADEIPYEEPISIYENTEITVYAKIRLLWFIKMNLVTETIDMLPIYNINLSEEIKDTFSLEITAPQDISRLKAALSIPENGYIDFTQMDIAAGGIGGAQFIVTRADSIQGPTYFTRAKQLGHPQTDDTSAENIPSVDQPFAPGIPGPDAGMSPITGEVVSLIGLSSSGYLTMRIPLEQNGMSSVDIVVNKDDLSDLLERNESIIIETFYSEQTLSVSVTTKAGALCKLRQGLLLELHGPGHLIGSYAKWENGDIIQKSVAREQTPFFSGGNIGPGIQPPALSGQNDPSPPPSKDGPPQSGPPQPPDRGLQEMSCSLIIPVKSFEGTVRLQIVDMLTDDPDGSTYTDVSNHDFDAVAYASGHGLLIGYDTPARTFGPDDSVEYGTVATVLFRLEGSRDSTNDKSYSSKKWSAEGTQWALDSGIVTSNENARFQRVQTLNQTQCLRMLWRLAHGGASDGDDVISDDEIQSWAINSGIISEDASNPNGTVSRIQLARIIRNYCIADADWKKAI